MLALSLCASLLSGCGPSQREADLEAREQAAVEAELEIELREEVLDSKMRHVAVQEDVLESTRSALEEQRLEFEDKAADARARELELQAQQNQLQEQLAAVQRLRDHWEATVKRGLPPQVNAGRAIVVDAVTGEALFEKNADEVGPVAGTQKLLTGLLLAEKGDLEDPVTIVQEDTEAAPVKFGIKSGDVFTKRQLLAILMLQSSTDVALAVARVHSGSVPGFTLRMNQRAEELGMENSRFANPHGLAAEADEQYSTARDMARLAIAADRQPDVRELVGLETFPLTRPDATVVTLENSNSVLKELEFCDGMKTGFTDASGHCLIVSGEKNGLRRIVVVLNGDGAEVASEAAALLEWSMGG